MSFSLKDLIAFFVDFEEDALYKLAPPGVMETRPRDANKLIELFAGYATYPIIVEHLDFSAGMPDLSNGSEEAFEYFPNEIGSLLFNYETHARVVINSMARPSGKAYFNRCYRRFLAMKEAYHVILRLEFNRVTGAKHPDTSNPIDFVRSAEELVHLPFSIVDFDSPNYSDREKIENAAELLAFLTFYPLDQIANDRKEFLSRRLKEDFNDPHIMTTTLFYYAAQHLVPQRYVSLLFRWHRFDRLYSLYSKLRKAKKSQKK